MAEKLNLPESWGKVARHVPAIASEAPREPTPPQHPLRRHPSPVKGLRGLLLPQGPPPAATYAAAHAPHRPIGSTLRELLAALALPSRVRPKPPAVGAELAPRVSRPKLRTAGADLASPRAASAGSQRSPSGGRPSAPFVSSLGSGGLVCESPPAARPAPLPVPAPEGRHRRHVLQRSILRQSLRSSGSPRRWHGQLGSPSPQARAPRRRSVLDGWAAFLVFPAEAWCSAAAHTKIAAAGARLCAASWHKALARPAGRRTSHATPLAHPAPRISCLPRLPRFPRGTHPLADPPGARFP